ncbi:aldehyde dehydrogenase [Lutibacter sp.]|uniref:aldehyde dehydrogenase n=1 Tax=Lutibacter sp. TaxID=1925666 RepID=UPI0035690360
MKEIIEIQREFFNSNATKSFDFRISQLKKFKTLLKENEEAIHSAIYKDFKRSSKENYIAEIGLIYHEINNCCKNLKKWGKRQKVKTNLLNMPSKSYIIPEPLGVTLIIGAWNYPYILIFGPMVAAISAGNTAVLTPSELSLNTSSIIAKLINENFEPRFLKVIEGGIEETTELLNQKFDKIFFTGSPAVGKIVYQAAAKNLTPVTLELGGKSPAIFTEDCNLKIGIKRLIWAKFLNAGQTCIAPDYVLVHESQKEKFLKLAITELKKSQYSIENDNYVQIINRKNTQRIVDLMDSSKIYYGGNFNIETRYIEPTLMTNINFDDKVMQEEIFGPILPIISYTNLDQMIANIKSFPKPLALYLFTNNNFIKNKILNEISFGGGAVNDAVMHFTNSNMPFGGVGNSGTGSYHGKYGFNEFSHFKSILAKPTFFEPPLKYSPYSKTKLNFIKKIFE